MTAQSPPSPRPPPEGSTPVTSIFRDDGWFNKTKAAKHFGKRLDKFWESAETAA